jgi:hypothetical protein
VGTVTTSGDTKYTEVQQTHYDGCWKDRTHYACALREIERLRADLLTADGQAQELQGGLSKWKARAQVMRGLLRESFEGLDEYWVTTPEGVSWILRVNDVFGDD